MRIRAKSYAHARIKSVNPGRFGRRRDRPPPSDPLCAGDLLPVLAPRYPSRFRLFSRKIVSSTSASQLRSCLRRPLSSGGFAHLVVEYEELPALGLHPQLWRDAVKHMRSGRAILPRSLAHSWRPTGRTVGRKLKRTFSFNRQGGMPLETRGCVANFHPHENTLTLYSSTQTHYAVRMNLAELLQLPEQNVRVVAGHVGGGFGAKSRPYIEEIVISHASRLIGRPVKWIEDRLEHMMATTQSRGIDTEIEVGYDDRGIIHALKARLTVDVGAYIHASGIITAEVAASHCRGPYRIPNATVDVICVGTNKTPLATCRGAGQPEATFPLECLIDLIARDVMYVIRRRNLIRPSDMLSIPYSLWRLHTLPAGTFPNSMNAPSKRLHRGLVSALAEEKSRGDWLAVSRVRA